MNRQRIAHGRILPFRVSPEQMNQRRADSAFYRTVLAGCEAHELVQQLARNRAALIRCAKRRHA